MAARAAVWIVTPADGSALQHVQTTIELAAPPQQIAYVNTLAARVIGASPDVTEIFLAPPPARSAVVWLKRR